MNSAIYLVYSTTNGLDFIGAYDSIQRAMIAMSENIEPNEEYIHIVRLPINESSEGLHVAGYNQGEIWEQENVL